MIYHELGMVAQERSDFDAAEQWYLKSLAIDEKHGNEHSAAGTYGQLGVVAGLRQRYLDSGRWLLKCICGFARQNDPARVKSSIHNLGIAHQQANTSEQAAMKIMWDEAGIGPWPFAE